MALEEYYNNFISVIFFFSQKTVEEWESHFSLPGKKKLKSKFWEQLIFLSFSKEHSSYYCLGSKNIN